MFIHAGSVSHNNLNLFFKWQLWFGDSFLSNSVCMLTYWPLTTAGTIENGREIWRRHTAEMEVEDKLVHSEATHHRTTTTTPIMNMTWNIFDLCLNCDLSISTRSAADGFESHTKQATPPWPNHFDVGLQHYATTTYTESKVIKSKVVEQKWQTFAWSTTYSKFCKYLHECTTACCIYGNARSKIEMK